MKQFRIIGLFVSIALLMSSAAMAQKRFSEGTIWYDVVFNTDGGDQSSSATNVVYIKGPRSRTEMKSSLGTQSTIIEPSNSATILKEFGDKKYLIRLTPEEWLDANRRNNEISFAYDAADTKTILGYTCRKAMGKYADGTTFTAWYTTELIPENQEFDPMTRTLPGLAMEYETNFGNVTARYTVSRISFAPVPASKFELPKTGFRVLTYKESKAL